MTTLDALDPYQMIRGSKTTCGLNSINNCHALKPIIPTRILHLASNVNGWLARTVCGIGGNRTIMRDRSGTHDCQANKK